MTAKGDSLTRLVERTTGQADVVQPLMRPMFSPAPAMMGIGEGLSTRQTDLSMINETSVESKSAPVAPNPVDRISFSPVSPPVPGITRDLPDTPLLDINGDRPEKDATGSELPLVKKNKNSLPKGLGDRQEIGINVDRPEKEVAGSELSAAGKNKNSLPKGLGDRQPIDVEVNRIPQSPLLLVDNAGAAGPADVSESVSPLLRQNPGDQAVSVIESLKRRSRFQTGFYARKDSKRMGEPPATPVVRVTIGRIDVRAIMQQSQVQPTVPIAEPVKPMLSLEEYLRQRDGGER